ncbi:MAG: type II secretion system protein GspG [Chthoniobacterales bacterium]
MTGSNSTSAFTIIELLVVMAIIIVLAGLILATSGYVQEKSKRSRAEAEIAAMSAALEGYKADNGIYPTDPQMTETVNPSASPVPATASKFLYASLTADPDFDGGSDGKSYMTFPLQNLQAEVPGQPISSSNHVVAVRDPFGNPYGYSTMKAANPNATGGFNPTFDLWSTAGTPGASAPDQAKWIKNW